MSGHKADVPVKRGLEAYERYTSTSSLPLGTDDGQVLEWSLGYFRANYSKLIPGNLDAAILDVGCGYGRYLKALSEMGYANCYGIDISAEQICYAREVLQLQNVEKADAFEWLKDRTGIFDCVLALDILEHLSMEDLLTFGGLLHRSLKPGGVAIFQVPNALSPLNPIIHGDLTHVRAFTPQSLRQFGLLSGFEMICFCEIPPYVRGIKTAIQRIIWSGIAGPLVRIFSRVFHGRVVGGRIVSSNFIGFAKK